MPPVLRPDQNELTDKARAAFRSNRRVLVQAACGYGKTHLGCGIVASAEEKKTRTLIIAHRRRLIDQWSDRLQLFGVPHGIIMANLPEALAERHRDGALVQLASKDTLISRGESDGYPIADLVIPDEAHNLLGTEYSKLISHYSKAYILGLTATPISGDGRGLGSYFDSLVCAPASSWLIANGIIVPYKVYAALEMAEARKTGGAVKPAGDPVVQWKRHANDGPTVLFAPRVAISKEIVTSFNKAGIHAVHIDSHSTEEERESAADGLEVGNIKVVSQVGLWTEGVDVPCISVVQLVAKCGSLVKFIQAVMRAGRAFQGKTHATVIDHTGAVFEHGFPDDDIEWSLTPGEVLKKSGEDDKPPSEPFVCTNCGLCYRGKACPACGSHLAINRQMYQPDLFAHLVEIDRENETAAKSEGPQRHWIRLLFQFANSGRKVGQLNVAFFQITGMWPNQAGVSPYQRAENTDRVADVYHGFVKRKKEPKEVDGMFK